MAKIPVLGRPSDSRNRIVNEFRGRIVAGELDPGSRFPTRSEIELQYGVSSVTVQRALECLRYDGFIRVNGRQGTFVADNPPHLSRYAVVFPNDTSNVSRRFGFAFAKDLETFSNQRPECQLSPYRGIDDHENSDDFIRLRQEVIDHSIAGLIFTTHPYHLRNTPLLDEPNIPRVAIMDPTDLPLPFVVLDVHSFFSKALDALKQQGHRRIAFLKNTKEDFSRQVQHDLLAERGMETRPYWMLETDVEWPSAARSFVHLLMHCQEIPDALIICDDNFVESATLGMQDAGDRVPAGFGLIAHANFPYPTPCHFPARRLGFDTQQILQLCVESINTQRTGKPVAPITRVAACFEEDITPNAHTPKRR